MTPKQEQKLAQRMLKNPIGTIEPAIVDKYDGSCVYAIADKNRVLTTVYPIEGISYTTHGTNTEKMQRLYNNVSSGQCFPIDWHLSQYTALKAILKSKANLPIRFHLESTPCFLYLDMHLLKEAIDFVFDNGREIGTLWVDRQMVNDTNEIYTPVNLFRGPRAMYVCPVCTGHTLFRHISIDLADIDRWLTKE